MRSIQYFLCHPSEIVKNIERRYRNFLPDSLYLKLVFEDRMGYPLNLKNPKTFNEKLQWLKLYDRRPEYTIMVDKYAVKQYVADIIGEQYIIPTLGVWDKPEDIEWDRLPNQFVLKCTHDSGGLVICKDKAKLDKQAAIKKLTDSLHRDYYMAGREWPYKNVPRRIIAEQFMEDENGELNDYKVFNFNGEPKIVQVDYNRFKGHLRNLYTAAWERINATICFPTDPQREFPKPEVFDELKELCEKLSMGIPHVRSDFYIVNNKIFFGELTFYHGSGFERIEPDSFDKQLGDWIQLPIGNGGGKNLMLRKNNMYVIVRVLQKPNTDLPDYKFFCFNGEVKAMFIATDRQNREEPYFDFFDKEFNHLDMRHGHPNAPVLPQKPKNFELMKQLAEKLSKGMPQVRVDLYEVNGSVYFGELTLFHHSGWMPFEPSEWDYTFGSWITLPLKEKK